MSDNPVEIIMFSRVEPPCHACAAMKPIMANIPNSRVVDVNDDPALAQRYRVMTLPTFIKLVDGEYDSQLHGAMPTSKLIKWAGKQ